LLKFELANTAQEYNARYQKFQDIINDIVKNGEYFKKYFGLANEEAYIANDIKIWPLRTIADTGSIIIQLQLCEDAEGYKCRCVISVPSQSEPSISAPIRSTLYTTMVENAKRQKVRIKFNSDWLMPSHDMVYLDKHYLLGDPFNTLKKAVIGGELAEVFQNWNSYTKLFPEPPFLIRITELRADRKDISIYHMELKLGLTMEMREGKYSSVLNIRQNTTIRDKDQTYRKEVTNFFDKIEKFVKRK
jgi:hypothetical protein